MLALIPARSGSKGLPGKNVRLLQGKPLLAYSIEAALASTQVSRVIVTTDCEVIRNVALAYGAEVPFLRPRELATDSASAVDVYIHALSALSNQATTSRDEYDKCLVLLPTCPLRLPTDIDAAVEVFHTKDADSVMSYTEEHHPVVWHKYLSPENKIEHLFPDTLRNRQDERKSYYPNGSIYVFRRELLESRRYLSEHSYAYVMPRDRSVDIDTIEDFEYAEYLMGLKREIRN